MKRAVLALPAAVLLLFSDRLLPGTAPAPPRHVASDLPEVYRALPPRNEGRFGRTGDALNLIFLGTESAVRSALEKAGWTSLPLSVAGSTRGVLKDILSGKTLARFPPMNDYRLMGRTQDMNWVRVIKPVSTRHHFRLWRTGIVDVLGREVWWGSGDYDLSVRWYDLSHRPDPDMDRERDFVASSLAAAPGVEGVRLLPLPQIPRSGANDKGYPFNTDGRALVVELASRGR
ncbi:MAG: LssY C-terminal domain-containing protein [Elusimicrobia bacterium]|nr:LssY C-terminal domain-containing protein [Elusimicrobiota bacterium]